MIWALGEMQFVAELPALLVGVFIIFFILAWFAFAVWATPITTNWLMSTGMGFVLKPFEKAINKRLDKTLEDGCSEFNRIHWPSALSWRDLDLEAWKNGEGWNEVHRRQENYPWGERTCKLTPQLGKISMEEYRKQRPESAWPI
ncbi:hypothetical protein Q9245_03485 [Marinobacter sp. MDS2]|nr:hypothetical protein [Marinobacter sp. MDS2]